MRWFRGTSVRLLVGFVALILLACGDDGGGSDAPASTAQAGRTGSAQPTPSPVDPCKLVTKAEAEATAGKALQDGVTPAGARGLLCEFRAKETVPPSYVRVAVNQTPSEELARAAFENLRKSQIDPPLQEVTGVGDEAVWMPGFKQLNVRKGRTIVAISGEGSIDAMKILAEKAFSRL